MNTDSEIQNKSEGPKIVQNSVKVVTNWSLVKEDKDIRIERIKREPSIDITDNFVSNSDDQSNFEESNTVEIILEDSDTEESNLKGSKSGEPNLKELNFVDSNELKANNKIEVKGVGFKTNGIARGKYLSIFF